MYRMKSATAGPISHCYWEMTCPWPVAGKWRVLDLLLGNDVSLTCYWEMTCPWPVTGKWRVLDLLLATPALQCGCFRRKHSRSVKAQNRI